MTLLVGAAMPGIAAAATDEPTLHDCEAAVGAARALALDLPAENLSRYFAERHLHQAMMEAGNGEFDECVEMAERAAQLVRERRHDLSPGEKLKVLKPDE
ncbi:hypothetical protein [Bradyrhizobium sp. 21]|uniref:hypothetical protein n=1 Tax=Bradyrhizobium sp. 21 TaxID=2782666 RepID=UPI001FF9D6FB|nr:hypothetical protein [Bradyrhizobium sp. 21]MCK1383264.1 hypothetical protein [Bradyrhizobium sp. 21]